MKNKLILISLIGCILITGVWAFPLADSLITTPSGNLTQDTIVEFFLKFNDSESGNITFSPEITIKWGNFSAYHPNGTLYYFENITIQNATLAGDFHSGNLTYFWNTTNYNDSLYNFSFAVRDKINESFPLAPPQIQNATFVLIDLNRTIIQEPIPQTPTQQTSNSGGGYSSSGSSGSSTISKLFAEITSNGVSFVPNSSKVSINKLFIATKTTVVNIRIDIGNVKAEQISKIAPLEVYEYLQITSSSLSDDVIATARINFYVNNTWLDKHNAESVKLYRYHNSLWQELITTKLNSDEQYTYYISETPGFSYFAIIASEIEISNISESVEGTLIETQTKTSPITGAATGFLSEGNYLVFILAGLILVLFILLLVRIRKLKQNEN